MRTNTNPTIQPIDKSDPTPTPQESRDQTVLLGIQTAEIKDITSRSNEVIIDTTITAMIGKATTTIGRPAPDEINTKIDETDTMIEDQTPEGVSMRRDAEIIKSGDGTTMIDEKKTKAAVPIMTTTVNITPIAAKNRTGGKKTNMKHLDEMRRGTKIKPHIIGII